VASRLCDEAKPGQILISPRVLTKVENAVKVVQTRRIHPNLVAATTLTTKTVEPRRRG
jgi:class 3 adenylate cyclase